jgi:hypothetical protein
MRRYITPGETEPEIRPAWPFVLPVLIGAAFFWVAQGPEFSILWLIFCAPFTWAPITNWAPGRKRGNTEEV